MEDSTFFFEGDTVFLAERATRGGVLGVGTDPTAAAAVVVGDGAPSVPPASPGFPAGGVI